MIRFCLTLLVICGIGSLISGCTTIEPSAAGFDFNNSDLSPSYSRTKSTTSTYPRNAGQDVAKLVPGNMIELSVEVDGKMEVSMHRASINHAGIVTLPLVGDVKVGGVPQDRAKNLIARTYAPYFVSPPVVMVNVVDVPGVGEWGYITVTGRVETPGRVEVTSSKGMKLTAVIQEAGGFAPSAKKTDVRVTRVDEQGNRTQVTVNYQEIGKKGNVEADLDLKDGDIVYVPERIF